MGTIEELLSAYEDAETLAEAESALDALAGQAPTDEHHIGDLYDQLADLAVEEDDFSLAVRAQRRAIELGCEHLDIAREMLAWYLLKEGQREAGEAAFSQLQAERGADFALLLTIGNARLDSGDASGALDAFDDALALAKRSDDPDAIYEARAERRGCREEMRLEPDDDDLEVRRVAIGRGSAGARESKGAR
ncbi:MAG: hypothetical protein MSC30_19280 [Gaiellaceae bacterium MAG52_C11]|nr:hypothetical protein [Candidatus Gaiellasilicea maunaloa]